jgi:hypothetical protein
MGMTKTETAKQYRAAAIRIAGPVGHPGFRDVPDHGRRECARWVAIVAKSISRHRTARRYRAAAMELTYPRQLRASERGRSYILTRCACLLRHNHPNVAAVAARCTAVLVSA